MKSNEIEASLECSVVGTFAAMPFLDVIKIDNFQDKIQASQILFITFTRPVQGCLALFLPISLKLTIAQNIYTVDSTELKAHEIDDCLLELVNVLAGNFLTCVSGTAEEQVLSLPQMVFDEKQLPSLSGIDDCYFNAEGDFFRVSVFIQEPKMSARQELQME